MIHCPNCKSVRVLAFDHSPLCFNPDWLKEVGQQFDSEIYIEFKCQNCTHKFSQTFQITKKQ